MQLYSITEFFLLGKSKIRAEVKDRKFVEFLI